MPRLSDEVEEGILVTWFVEPDARVKRGDLIAEVQVEKVSEEVFAQAGGRVIELLVAPGDPVAQGHVIAVIEDAEPAGVPASPAARRLARELGVDLGSVIGSGPAGRIVEEDVRTAAEAPGGREALGRSPSQPRPEPLSPMRRTIAERLQGWLGSTAQLTLTAEADVTELAGELARLGSSWGRSISYTEAAVRACALALRDHPRMGARWSDEGLVYPEQIDIGVAVALEEGLIVPVVRAAAGKDLEALGREIADLAERARGSRLTPRDAEGGAFSVTNLGAYGIDAFTPLLNPPQTAILGVGVARPRPAVVEGAVTVRTLVVLSLTFDHRVADGAPAASFLADVVAFLEEPGRLLAPAGDG